VLGCLAGRIIRRLRRDGGIRSRWKNEPKRNRTIFLKLYWTCGGLWVQCPFRSLGLARFGYGGWKLGRRARGGGRGGIAYASVKEKKEYWRWIGRGLM